MKRAHDRGTTLFVAFARDDLVLARPAAEQLRVGAAALRLDYSTRHEAFDTEAAAYLRASLELRISRCAATLCLLGARTADDPWVRWTLDTAKTLGRPLLGAPLRDAPDPAADLFRSLGVEIVPLRPAAIRERLHYVPPLAAPPQHQQANVLALTLELFKRHLR